MLPRSHRLALRCAGGSRRHATFGVPGLRTPEDCLRLARQAGLACDQLVDRVVAGAAEPSRESVMALDELSITFCSVLDAMECARNVHPSESFAQAANEAYEELGAKLAEINTDDRLHRAVVAALDDQRTAGSLSAEQRRFAVAMRAEFEHDGAHLGSVERGQLRALQAEEGRLVQRFVSGATARGDPRSGVWAPTEALRSSIPPRALASFAARGDLSFVPAERAALTAALESPIGSEATRRELFECREEVRRCPHSTPTHACSLCPCRCLGALWVDSHHALTSRALFAPRLSPHMFARLSPPQLARSNLPSLHALLSCRHAIATTLGATSYAAHRLTHDRMEGCPEAVQAALAGLSERLRPEAELELDLLRNAKRALGGNLASQPGGGQTGPLDAAADNVVQPWDLPLLMAHCRAQARGACEEDVAAYFELESCLDGLRVVLENAFGLSWRRAPAADGELWHASVRKMVLSRRPAAGAAASAAGVPAALTAAAGEPLGVLYLDLFPRARKTTQAGLYTLRSALRADAAAPSPSMVDRPPLATSPDDDDDPILLRHLPACVLVCSLPEPGGAGCDPRTGLAFLQHRQLER